MPQKLDRKNSCKKNQHPRLKSRKNMPGFLYKEKLGFVIPPAGTGLAMSGSTWPGGSGFKQGYFGQ
ncbi:hypothetical protein FJ414_22095 [Mesorhizobium sp. B3-1-6]|uniref:hypothetical protein n=1 Tax=Mesorhizobium sp. B3-1-6 TaxID=2589895 RepID=UPI001125CD40|nr:hypothetical protein [Mesorhizobium sp. B3-1-6]TPI32215.1 hypothetical protein FJ414_22095 [Mesorhizobium sp. B3-1-6]